MGCVGFVGGSVVGGRGHLGSGDPVNKPNEHYIIKNIWRNMKKSFCTLVVIDGDTLLGSVYSGET